MISLGGCSRFAACPEGRFSENSDAACHEQATNDGWLVEEKPRENADNHNEAYDQECKAGVINEQT